MIRSGYVIPVVSSFPVQPSRTWKLPHHGVTHPDKPGKLRVVFNCAAKFQGVCLNDMLLEGVDMLKQVRVPQNEQSFLQFVYRSPGSTEAPSEYQFAVHPFGATDSPACSLFALRQAANEYVNRFPETSEVIRDNIYVDNLFHTEENDILALRVYKEATTICKYGGLNLRDWMSNSRKVLDRIDALHRAHPDLDPTQSLPLTKALGMWWDPE